MNSYFNNIIFVCVVCVYVCVCCVCMHVSVSLCVCVLHMLRETGQAEQGGRRGNCPSNNVFAGALPPH